MLYTLTMRDDVEGAVCVVPASDDTQGVEGVLTCPAASAVAVADAMADGRGTWAPHPTLRVQGRPVAVAACDTTSSLVAAVNTGTPVEAALAGATPRPQPQLAAA